MALQLVSQNFNDDTLGLECKRPIIEGVNMPPD
jgi:hypothetical protein